MDRGITLGRYESPRRYSLRYIVDKYYLVLINKEATMPLPHLLLSTYTDPTIMKITSTMVLIILDLDIQDLHIQIHHIPTLGTTDIEILLI